MPEKIFERINKENQNKLITRINNELTSREISSETLSLIDSLDTGKEEIAKKSLNSKIVNTLDKIIASSKEQKTCGTVRSIPSGYKVPNISSGPNKLNYEYYNTLIKDLDLLSKQCGCNQHTISPSDTCSQCSHCVTCTCQTTCCNTAACNNSRRCDTDQTCYNCCNSNTLNCCNGDCTSYSAASGCGVDTTSCSCNTTACSTHRCPSYQGGCMHSDTTCDCNRDGGSCSCDSDSCCDTYCNDRTCSHGSKCCNTVACNPYGTSAQPGAGGCKTECTCNQHQCECNKVCSCNKVCQCNWV